MMFTSRRCKLIAAAVMPLAIGGGVLGLAGPASAKAFHPKTTGTYIFVLGQAPAGVIPASCDTFVNPTDAFGFRVVSGNFVGHTSTNKNGGWGGQTFEGSASLIETSTVTFTRTTQTAVQAAFAGSETLFSGHLTLWGGGGNNVKGQAETGFTLTFHGTNGSGASVTIHINSHTTRSAAGNASTHHNTRVSCS